MLKFGGYTPQKPVTAMDLSFGGTSNGIGISSNPMDYSLGVPSIPDVSVPQVNYLTPPATSTPGSVPTSVSISPVTPAAGAPKPFEFGAALKGMFVNEDGGFNMDGLDTMGKILGSVGSLYGAFKSYGIAKDSLDLNKRAFETNLNNQRQTYNTALEDRIRSRAAVEGRGSKYVSDYLNKNSL